MGCVNLRGKRQMIGISSETDELPFNVDLMVGISFYRVLIDAIDDAGYKQKKKRKRLKRGL